MTAITDTEDRYGYRSRRKVLGLNQEEAARRCGISTPYYRLLERGYEGPFETRERVAKALGMGAS